MHTYFARHGSDLDIDVATYAELWENGLVGAHYPYEIGGSQEESDSESTDPNDYERPAKQVLHAMRELAQYGGYVCAVYQPYPGCLIGYVEPETEVELLRGRWGDKNNMSGRQAVLKTLKLTKAQRLTKSESIALLASRGCYAF